MGAARKKSAFRVFLRLHHKKSENRTIDALDYLNYLYYCYICITVWRCICITVSNWYIFLADVIPYYISLI